MAPADAEAMTKTALMDLPEQPAAAPDANADSDLTAGRSPRPADDAPKAEWIAYVAARGLLSREDAANYTRDDLIHMTT
jgi:hypothetical protein